MDCYQENLETRYFRYPAPDRDESRSVIYQIASALEFIHRKNYVHRDLKPQNILITSDENDLSNPRVALGDFGLCKRVGENENASRAGTEPYNTAPETRLSQPFDIWSFGLIIFELFYISEQEMCPTREKTTEQLFRLKEQTPDRIKTFVGRNVPTKSYKRMVVDCLNRSPSQRLTAADIVSRLQPHGAHIPATIN